MSAVTNKIPSPLVVNGRVAHGSPLHRLQSIHDDPAGGAYAGDVRDVVLQSGNPSEPTIVKWANLVYGKQNGERVIIEPADVEHVTQLLLVPAIAK